MKNSNNTTLLKENGLSPLEEGVKRLLKNKVAICGIIILLIIVLVSIFAQYYKYNL